MRKRENEPSAAWIYALLSSVGLPAHGLGRHQSSTHCSRRDPPRPGQPESFGRESTTVKVNRVSHVAFWHKRKARRSRKRLCFCAQEGAFRSGYLQGAFLASNVTVTARSGSETILPGRGTISCSSISGTCIFFFLNLNLTLYLTTVNLKTESCPQRCQMRCVHGL